MVIWFILEHKATSLGTTQSYTPIPNYSTFPMKRKKERKEGKRG